MLETTGVTHSDSAHRLYVVRGSDSDRACPIVTVYCAHSYVGEEKERPSSGKGTA